MATTHLASSTRSYNDPSASQSSSGSLSGGKIAAIVIGTVLTIGTVCLLLFCPQYVFARVMRSGYRFRPSRRGNVPLNALPPARLGRASGNDRSGNGADDAGSRRRCPDVVDGGITQPHGNSVRTNKSPGSPIVINNNIYINSNDYLHPLPALNTPRIRGPAPPVIGTSRNAQRASGTRNVHSGPPPNGGIPPQRRSRGESPSSPVRAPTATQTDSPGFWDVADWARGVAPGLASHSRIRGRASSPTTVRQQNAERRRAESYTRVRAVNVPGAFPEDNDIVERFQLVTAPARVHAPGAPTHGDDGFWVRDTRENRWRRQEMENRRQRLEREDTRERQEREERRERDRHEREEREDRRERREREERREMQEREDRHREN